ncbi:hypothetical protein [Cohnella boryungensis]|uniref:DUF3139 domain-containing protein n=1 Tax=Cohnella boryungensis TaxID=768479 RepID=A0ABV8SGT4_9BACL
MYQVQSICLFLFMFILLLGIGLALNFNKNRKAFFIICSSTVLISFILALVVTLNIKVTKKDIIKKTINARHGTIISIIQADEKQQTPFGEEIKEYNTVYQIQYRIEGKYYTAWFRSVDLATNMEESLNGKGQFYKEKWIFNE